MTAIATHIRVGPDGSISATPSLPPGEYEVVVTMPPQTPRRSVLDIPIRGRPLDDSISLRREDLYE